MDVNENLQLKLSDVQEKFYNYLNNLRMLLSDKIDEKKKTLQTYQMVTKDSTKYCPANVTLLRPEINQANESISYSNYINLVNMQVQLSEEMKDSLNGCIQDIDTLLIKDKSSISF